MMGKIFFLMLSLGLLASAPNEFSDTGHFPSPERFTDPRLQNIGRLVANNDTYCTATLLPPRTIMTAAHCVIDERGKFISLPYVFRSGGLHVQDGRTLELDLGSARTFTLDFATNPHLDLAFISLRKPVEVEHFEKVAIASVASIQRFGADGEEAIHLTGYNPKLLAGGAGMSEACSEKGFYPTDQAFFHNCSTVEGMSGAPLYIFREGKLTIVGLHVAGNGRFHNDIVSFNIDAANIAIDGSRIQACFNKYVSDLSHEPPAN